MYIECPRDMYEQHSSTPDVWNEMNWKQQTCENLKCLITKDGRAAHGVMIRDEVKGQEMVRGLRLLRA